MRVMQRTGWLALCIWLLLWCMPSQSWAQAEAQRNATNCTPQLTGAWAAQEVQPNTLPSTGWEPISLPESWHSRWPDWQGPTWYRVEWHVPCPDAHLALSISAIRNAGAVYWNGELLWQDRRLEPPYSRSGNVPRWWPVSTAQRGHEQSALIRVVSSNFSKPGLGKVELGAASDLREATDNSTFRQRTAYMLTAAMSTAVGAVALFVWIWRRSELAYLWFAGMQLMWASYLFLLLRSEPLLWLSSIVQSKVQLLSFVLYAQCFWLFSLRVVGMRLPRLEGISWLALGLWLIVLLFDQQTPPAVDPVWYFRWGSLLVHISCVLVIVRALITRKAPHLWLALCWLGILVVATHDIVVAMRVWENDKTWSTIFSPVSTLFLAGLLGWQLASHLRRVDNFNAELQQHVAQARQELADVLSKQHALDLEHAKLQTRVHLAHDLHDGLGGSLVRSLALVEQSAPQLQKDRVLSMLKVLRDDLRQVIDVDSSSDVNAPETPVLWLAPLRHRFGMLVEELGMHIQWQVDAQWLQRPTTLQCMAMARFLEEAFSNVLKHSRASHIQVRCHQPDALSWVVPITDDGVGFDVAAVEAAGMGIGMHSMHTRLGKVNGSLQVASSPQGTTLTASITLPTNHIECQITSENIAASA